MPQKTWTAKDERMYKHIKESESDRDRGPKRAKQIAAATVNKRVLSVSLRSRG